MWSPSISQIKSARKKLKLTAKQAGAVIYVTESAWNKYEMGERKMHLSKWELFHLKTNMKEK